MVKYSENMIGASLINAPKVPAISGASGPVRCYLLIALHHRKVRMSTIFRDECTDKIKYYATILT